MSLQDLVAAVAATVVDEKKIEDLKNRLAESEKKFESQSLSKPSDQSFMARTYSL